MTLREALDLLELNERTLEQSMLEASLQNRLEHTELRHVLRVFEAYRKVNAFLNPSFSSGGDARLTIIDESLPGVPAPELARAAAPGVLSASAVSEAHTETRWDTHSTGATSSPSRDTFSDGMVVTDGPVSAITPTKQTGVQREGRGINAVALVSLLTGAFAIGVFGVGPLLGSVLKPAPSAGASQAATVLEPPPVAPPAVLTPPPAPPPLPSAPAVTTAPNSAPPSPPAQPQTSPTSPSAPATPRASTQPVVNPPSAPIRPTPSVTRPPATNAARPTVRTPAPTSTARSARPGAPRIARPSPPRPATVRSTPAPRAMVRPPARVAVSTPVSRRAANNAQFKRWDESGAVLRYRSWALVPDSVRALSPSAFRAAVFVARDPASLPDIKP